MKCQKWGNIAPRPFKCKKLLGCLYLHRTTIIVAGRHQIKFSQEISIRTTVTLYTFLFNYELLSSAIARFYAILRFTRSPPPCHSLKTKKKKEAKQKSRERFNARLSFNETFVFWDKKETFFSCFVYACLRLQCINIIIFRCLKRLKIKHDNLSLAWNYKFNNSQKETSTWSTLWFHLNF